MKSKTKISFILFLARASLIIRTSLIAASLLLTADLFIDVPGAAYLAVIMSLCIFTLLLARDDRLLYECDRMAGSGGLLLTLYYVKEGFFIGRLADSFRRMGVARFLRLNMAGHVTILALLLLANSVTGIEPIAAVGPENERDSATPAARLGLEVSRLEGLISSVRDPELRKRLAKLVQDAKKFLSGEEYKLDNAALHEAALGVMLADELTASAAVREELLGCVGKITALVKGSRLRYELKFAREIEAMAGLKNEAIHFSGEAAAGSRLADGDPDFRMAEQIPFKYKLALKRYFEGVSE